MSGKSTIIVVCFTILLWRNAWPATKTWDGSSSGNWATAANWSGGVAPVAGDDLVFPGGVTRLLTTNNFSPNRAFNSITFLGTNYIVRGSPLILTNGIRMGTLGNTQASPNVNTIETDIQLQAAETFRVTNLFAKLVVSGDVLLSPGCLEVSGNGDTAITGVVSGGCGISKTGFGFLTLSGNNTFSGTVFITDGRVIATDPSLSGATPLGDTLGGTILQGGILEIHVSVTNEALLLSGGDLFNNRDPGRWQGGPITIQSNSAIRFAGKFTIDAPISGNANLEVGEVQAISSWECVFAGSSANTLTGEVWIEDGRLVLDKTSVVAISGPLKVGGGFLADATVRENQNSQIAVVPVTLLTNAVLDLDGHSDGVGAVTLVGATVTNNGTGIFTINGNISAAYATRRSDIYGNVSLGSITRTFFVTNSDGFTGTELNVHDRVSGTGGLIKAGDGYMGLLASNSYSGLTTVSAGTLLAQDDFALGTTNNGTVVNSGATLYVASSTIAEPLTLNGDGDSIENRTGALMGQLATCSGPITLASDCTINVPAASPFNLSLSGPISGPGGITKIGPGTLLYSGGDDNTYAGDTWIRAGILTLNKSSAFAISNSASLTIGDSSDGSADDIVRFNAGGQIRTTANIFINRTGLLDLNNFTDDLGDISMVGGTIDTGTGTLQLRGTLTAIGTAFNLNFFPAHIVGNLDLGATARTFIINNDAFALGLNADLLLDAAVTVGSGTWTKTGPGEMALTHSNSFTGPLIVRDGGLIVTHPNALGGTANGLVISNSATLELAGNITISGKALTLDTTNTSSGAIHSTQGTNTWAGPVSLTRTATLLVDNASGLILSDALSGPGGVTKIGLGMLTYSGGAANAYTGTTTVNAGTLTLGKSIPNNSIVGPLVIGDGSGGANADVVRLQTTSQIGSLVPITINSSGLLDANGVTETFGSLAGSGNVTLGGATITAGGDGTSTAFSGVISEAGSFIKAGGGTMTLSGANSLSGLTTVSSGRLLVNGSQPQSPVSVGASGTLGGTGTIGILIGTGSVAPGASPGILTSSNLTFSSGGDFFVELTGPNAGADYDQLNVHGTNNLGNATLHVNPVFSTPVSVGQQFIIINNDGADPITGTFNGLAENSGFNAGGYGFRINYAAGNGNDVVLTLTNIPVDFFFTNVLGGDFVAAANWIPNAVPGVTNNANFTNNAGYTVVWTAGATNANAFFNAATSVVTQSMGAFAWQLTNSYIVGASAGATANVTHVSGTLRVTNAAGVALFDVRRGAFNLNAGTLTVDRFSLTNAGQSLFTFNAGQFNVQATSVANGQTLFVGNGTSSAVFNLGGNGKHSFANGLILRSNATLIGSGTITGAVTVLAGATVAPGTSIGRIVLSNAPVLVGTLVMEIGKTGSTLTNDQIQVAGPLSYGGRLTVTNIGPDSPGLGDRFVLFAASGFNNAFSSVALPSLGLGLSWSNNLSVDGSIQVVATSRPQFGNLSMAGTNLILSGSGGFSNANYTVLSTTNVGLPLSNWSALTTNHFDVNGNFIFSNAIAPAIPQRFYLLRVP